MEGKMLMKPDFYTILSNLKDFEWLGLSLSNDAIRTRLKIYLNFGYE